ncbi:unnamed protein product [Haemonchus placei]|uniref:Transthyretin-like family protein n=1 Tax=Haemonchus placei TaxID=6290 RepID=A0A0N4X6Q6_HAEPC|nr:unnamed protein product [Haemonchus placei]
MISKTLLFLLISPLLSKAFMKQSIGIRGVLRSGSKPLRDHAVKLYVSKIAPFSDVLVASNRTDSNGLFYLIGTTARIPLMTQYLVVENDCSGKEQKVELPSSLEDLPSSKEPSVISDVGVINLAISLSR